MNAKKTIFAACAIAAALALDVACKSDDTTSGATSTGSGTSASTANGATVDLVPPTDQTDNDDTKDITPANAESVLKQLENEVNQPY
jgi:hypothetical protein